MCTGAVVPGPVAHTLVRLCGLPVDAVLGFACTVAIPCLNTRAFYLPLLLEAFRWVPLLGCVPLGRLPVPISFSNLP
jgi:hypothetical protein